MQAVLELPAPSGRLEVEARDLHRSGASAPPLIKGVAFTLEPAKASA
jgi:hypothetical protein